RARGERAAGAVERVAPLDRDRLDPNDDAFRMALGIRNVLVLQDLGTAVLVVDRRLHRAASLFMHACECHADALEAKQGRPCSSPSPGSISGSRPTTSNPCWPSGKARSGCRSTTCCRSEKAMTSTGTRRWAP